MGTSEGSDRCAEIDGTDLEQIYQHFYYLSYLTQLLGHSGGSSLPG